MAVIHIDRTRSFGVVFGGAPSHRYIQDGLPFDAAGEHRTKEPQHEAKPRGPGRPRKHSAAEEPVADLFGFEELPEES